MKKNNILKLLNKGELVIMPSDTVYGIFANALDINAIKRVEKAKNSNKPHLIVVSSTKMLKKYVSEINDLQKKIIKKYWPNTLTILFKKSDLISDELTKGSDYIAIRMPKDKELIDLIDSFGKPLISTSANISNEKVITNIDELDNNIKEKVSYIYDRGTLSDVASTIIKVENNKITFLREGELASIIKQDFEKYI